MEIKDVLQALRAGWWLVVSGLLICVAAAGLVTWQTTPQYSSSTRLFVSTSSDGVASALSGSQFSQQRVASYVQLITGRELASRVVDELGLADSPGQLAGSITATTSPDTVLLDVTVTRESATQARDIAAALGQQFTLYAAELETLDGATTSTVKVTVVEEPEVAVSPTTPRPARNLALGALAGLLLGAAGALLRARLDNTVRTGEELRELTGTGLVGALLEDPSLARTHLVSSEDGYSETAEAYRQVRTNLQFLDVDNPAKTIVVTSSLPGEGKTTVAVNLALVLAQSGARVTLIEADLRRPRVTRYLGMISGAGLSNVLAGTATYEELVQPYGEGNLNVLAAGPMPPNPSEMLGSRQMRTLLDDAKSTSNYVIIDAPPLLPVTDASVLAVSADGALLVTRYGNTTRAQVQKAAENLHRIEAKLLGTILNRVPTKSATGYGYGYAYTYEPSPDRLAQGSKSSGLRGGERKRTTFETSPIAVSRGDRQDT